MVKKQLGCSRDMIAYPTYLFGVAYMLLMVTGFFCIAVINGFLAFGSLSIWDNVMVMDN